MTLEEVVKHVNGTVLTGEVSLTREVEYGFSSDLMSDVLTLLDDNILLITGLSNNQAVRTAEMSDIHQVLFVRGKMPDKGMIQMAKEHGITLITTSYSMFRTSGILYNAGLPYIY